MASTCPLLDLQPVLQTQTQTQSEAIRRMIQNPGKLKGMAPTSGDVQSRVIQENNQRIMEWTRRMCAYVDELADGGSL